MRLKVMRVCRGEAVAVVPLDPLRYDLAAATRKLEARGYEVEQSDVMVVAERKGIEVTLYPNGRLMIRPAMEKGAAVVAAAEFYEDIATVSVENV